MSFVTQPYIGEITRIARQYEARLAQYETTILNQTGARYRVVARSLADDLDLLERKISARIAAGEDVPVSWLHREQRYRTMIQHVEANMSAYGESLYQGLSANQERIVNLAMQNAAATIDASIGGVTRGLYSFNRIPTQALENLYGSLSEGSPLEAITASFGTKAKEAIDAHLTSGLAKGLHPSQITTNILKDVKSLTEQRAATITRTEVYRSYREGNRATYEANPQTVGGWVWFAHLGGQTCAACLAMHGTEHPTDEPMGSHPNCRCTMLPKTKSWADLGFYGMEEFDVSREVGNSETWLRAQDEKTQRLAFGNNKVWKGWQNGDYELQDVVRRVDHPDWGTTRTISGYDGALLNRQYRIANQRAMPVTPPKPTHIPHENSRIEAIRQKKTALQDNPNGYSEAELRDVGRLAHEDYLERRARILAQGEDPAIQLRKDALLKKYNDDQGKLFEIERELRHGTAYGPDATQTPEERKKLLAKYQKLQKGMVKDREEYETLGRISPTIRASRQAAKETLQEVDATFGTGQLNMKYATKSSKEVKGYLDDTAQFLPKNWVDDYNESSLLKEVSAKKVKRGFFRENRYDVDVNISSKSVQGMEATAIHEMQHYREYISPRLRAMEREFYNRRTAGEGLSHMGPGFGPNEVTRRDQFLNPYIGKDYSGRYYEVTSMGVEQLFSLVPRFDIADDPDFLNFIMGVLVMGV